LCINPLLSLASELVVHYNLRSKSKGMDNQSLKFLAQIMLSKEYGKEFNWSFHGELKTSSPQREEIFPVLNKGWG
jgi:hypothetical protein